MGEHQIQTEKRVNTKIVRLLLNLLLLHHLEEWMNNRIKSEEKVNTNLLLQLFQSEERMMRLLLNLLLLHQSEEWVNKEVH